MNLWTLQSRQQHWAWPYLKALMENQGYKNLTITHGSDQSDVLFMFSPKENVTPEQTKKWLEAQSENAKSILSEARSK